MKVKIHRLFEILLKTETDSPEAVLGFSQAASPQLKDFLDDLDPELSLDWSNQSFQGLPALREQIIGRSGLDGICTTDDVLVTAGAAEANFLAITHLIEPGDELLVEAPGWPQPAVLGETLSARIVLLPRREENGWQVDLDEMARLITPRTKLIFLSNPNNPTGQVMRERELRRISQMAGRFGAYVLVDEAYAGLEWEGERVPSIAGLYERGISTGTVSKALGLQGLRIGWLICPDPGVVRETMILRENTSEIMNVIGEYISEIALRPERYARTMDQTRAASRRNLEMLDRFVTSRPELSWHKPPAGLIGLCRLHLPLDGETVAQRMLQPPFRTFIIPGSAFGCPQHIRLGVGGGAKAELEKGLTRLARFLDELEAAGSPVYADENLD